jgi:hypothetical protein
MDVPDMWFPRRSALFGGENFDEASHGGDNDEVNDNVKVRCEACVKEDTLYTFHA